MRMCASLRSTSRLGSLHQYSTIYFQAVTAAKCRRMEQMVVALTLSTVLYSLHLPVCEQVSLDVMCGLSVYHAGKVILFLVFQLSGSAAWLLCLMLG